MHTFLTGDIQVGKSTIIRRYIEHTKVRIGGFKTVFVPRGDGSDALHIVRADGTDVCCADNLIFIRNVSGDGTFSPISTETFETAGVALLSDVSACDLVIMDELGPKEEQATAFQAAVLAHLDGDKPIMGVVMKRESKFLDKVRSHPNVRMITVTVENREDILLQLLDETKLEGTK